MKKNFDQPIKQIDGTPFMDGDKPYLMTKAILDALLSPVGDEKTTGHQKTERYALALKLHKGGQQDYTTEELTTIKDRVGITCTVLAVGQIYNAVDA